jgi:hypothetical protein
MTHPRVTDGEDGLQIWRGLRIYQISSCGQPTMGGPPIWGYSEGITTTHRKKKSLLRNVT